MKKKMKKYDNEQDVQRLRLMHDAKDMLTGCINRIFISDDSDEIPRLRDGAKSYIDRLFELSMERFKNVRND